MPKYLFFDFDNKILKPLQEHLPKLLKNNHYHSEDYETPIEFDFFLGDILELRKLLQENHLLTYWVSPANSHGDMNGGIDAIYSQMFPECERLVKQKIQDIQRFFPIMSPTSRRPILSVGSAAAVKLGSPFYQYDQGTHNEHMICVPTMEVPHHLKATPQNVYYAMYALIQVTKNLDPNTIVAIPGLGTGVGQLTGEEACQQIVNAFQDYINYRSPTYPSPVKTKYQTDDHYLISPPCLF